MSGRSQPKSGGGIFCVKSSRILSRKGRMSRRAAQKDAARTIVSHITSHDSAQYCKKNPVPTRFWAELTAQ